MNVQYLYIYFPLHYYHNIINRNEEDIIILFDALSLNHNIYKCIISGDIIHIDNNKNILANNYIKFIKNMYSIETLSLCFQQELNNDLHQRLNINNINEIRKNIDCALKNIPKQNIFMTNINQLNDIYHQTQLQNIPMLTLLGIEIIIDIKKCLDNIKVLHILDCTDARKLFMPIIKKIKT